MPRATPRSSACAAQVVVRVDLVPRDVQRDARGERRHTVDLRGIRDLLVRVARRARRGEHLEARAGVAERPRGQLDGLGLEGLQDGGRQGAHDGSLSSSVAVDGAWASWSSRWKTSGSGRKPSSAGPSRSAKKGAIVRCPAVVDGRGRHARPRGLQISGLEVADEQAVVAEEERIVAPPGVVQRGQHVGPDGGVGGAVVVELLGPDLQSEADALHRRAGVNCCHGRMPLSASPSTLGVRMPSARALASCEDQMNRFIREKRYLFARARSSGGKVVRERGTLVVPRFSGGECGVDLALTSQLGAACLAVW